jgi:CubicO group peptidase (beta-lactamase class C family)
MSVQLYILSLLFSLSTPAVPDQKVITRVDGTTISIDDLDTKINAMMKRGNVSGLCIAIFNDDEPVFTRAYGYANAQEKKPLATSDIMYSASFSKTVFAYLVMKLVESGTIDLDTPLVSYLDKPLMDYKFDDPNKGYQDLRNDPRYKKITARMCLDHTSGLPNYRSAEPDKKLKFYFDPGIRYSYSGEGMCYLQFVIEQVTGKSFEGLVQQKVLRPLHMYHTSYIWQDDFADKMSMGHDNTGKCYPTTKVKEPDCSATMHTSMDDYVKFYTALMQQKGLKKSSYKTMLSPQVRIRSKQQFGSNAFVETTDNDKVELSYGLGFGLLTTPYGKAFFKEGHESGWQHYSIAFPDQDIAVIIMTNSDNGESIFKELLTTSIADTYTPWAWENYP